MTPEELSSRLQALEEMARAAKTKGAEATSKTSKWGGWGNMVLAVFPEAALIGEGWSKKVYGISEELVLKVGQAEDMKITMQAYDMICKSGFADMVAAVLASSEHCMIQERGEPGEVPEIEAAMTKKLMNQFGVTDARAANFMRFGTGWKLIDFTPVGLNSFRERKKAREGTMESADPFGIGFAPIGSSKRRGKGSPWSGDLQF